MIEQQKILRVLLLISKLKHEDGCSKAELAASFNVSTRTVERYFQLFEDLGFVLEKNKSKFRLKTMDSSIQAQNLVIFTLEEAQIIHEIFRNSTISSEIQKSILDKLLPLSEITEISEFISRGITSKYISQIAQAIQDKKQVKIVQYNSLNSKTKEDRWIEPVKFTKYYESVIAFDIQKKQMRTFKPTRMEGVEIMETTWQHQEQHQQNSTDIFNVNNTQSWQIKVVLSERAQQLLLEEFPQAKQFVRKQKTDYVLECTVHSLEATARFLQGFIQEIQIISPQPLKKLIIQNLQKGLKDLAL